MAFIPTNIDRSTLVFVIATGLAFATKITSTAIITRLATTSLAARPTAALAIAASTFEFVSLITLMAAAGLFLRRVSGSVLLLGWITGVASCLLGTILTLIALVSALHLTDDHATKDGLDNSNAHDLAKVGIAIALIGLVPQSLFYTTTWPRLRKDQLESVEDVQERHSPRSMHKQSIAVHMGAIPASPKSFGVRQYPEPTSPSFSAFTLSPRSSLRHSAGNALRPMTSRTRLLLGTSWGSTKDSKEIHISSEVGTEAIRSTDEFENWDTSKVDEDFENSFRSKTRLETIPGSRPVSPAHPLNGPFAGDADELPTPTTAADTPVASPWSETGSLRSIPRSMSVTRRASAPDADESHIHPLFRTESPAPPPMTSPGTIITASPYAGQIITPELALITSRLLGSAHGSRPASPIISPIRSRAGSVKSFRSGVPTSSGQGVPLPPLTIPTQRLLQFSSPISPND